MSKISDLPVLNDAHGGAYIPVVWNGENMRIYLSKLSAAADNFAPYDPAEEYNSDQPDFVSFNGNVYEYIYPTPDTGKVPTNATYWRIVSAGQFNHQQNTDTSTNSDVFSIGNPQGQDQEGWRILAFRENAGGHKVAIGYHFDLSVIPEVHELKICYDYTGTGSDVWIEWGVQIDDSNANPDTTYSGEFITAEFGNVQSSILTVETTLTNNIGDLQDRVDVLEAGGGATTDASSLTSGTLSDARLSTNVPLKDAAGNTYTGMAWYIRPSLNPIIAAALTGDPNTRFMFRADGYMEWGSGAAPADTNYYRAAAGLLKTDHKFNAANGLQHKGADLIDNKTGTVVDFVAMTTYFNTLASPGTTNITADLTGATVGNTAFMFHNSGTEPTFTTSGVTFNKISGTYALGATNRIFFHYVGGNTIDYSIR